MYETKEKREKVSRSITDLNRKSIQKNAIQLSAKIMTKPILTAVIHRSGIGSRKNNQDESEQNLLS